MLLCAVPIKEFPVRLLVLCSFLFMSVSAFAQLYPSTSQDITPEEASALFQELEIENAKMDTHSECFERAHMWARYAEHVRGIQMEKVYLFFTYKFTMKHRVTSRWGRAFTWWFHVAPAVRVNGELWVMDATFTDQAMPVQDWAQSLMKTPETCEELSDPQDYVSDRNSTNGYRNVGNARSQCYYTTAPKYFYQPLEIGFREGNKAMMEYVTPANTPVEWNKNTLNWALQSYKGRANQRQARQLLGL
jgi:hypothetical protein